MVTKLLQSLNSSMSRTKCQTQEPTDNGGQKLKSRPHRSTSKTEVHPSQAAKLQSSLTHTPSTQQRSRPTLINAM